MALPRLQMWMSWRRPGYVEKRTNDAGSDLSTNSTWSLSRMATWLVNPVPAASASAWGWAT